MTEEQQAVSEDDLQAYVDGRLEPGRLAVVEAFLEAHPEDAARVDAYRRQSAALRAAIVEHEADEIPERLRATLHGGNRALLRRWAPRAAAAAILLSLGFAAGWTLHETSGPDYAADAGVDAAIGGWAAAAHRVYSVEVRHPVEVRAEEAHLVRWLSKRVGVPLKAPDLNAQGFRLMGGRLLPAGAGAAAQMMYEDAAGRRVTVYITINPAGGQTAFRFLDEQGLSAFYWLDDRLGYALVGDLGREDLLGLAREVHQQMTLRSG